jgi:D-3-phosphoglycerate dehydrogenase
VKRAQAFGMRVVAWSRSLDDAKAKALGVERAPDLLTLAKGCDALSIHLPLKPETRGAVSRQVLEAMKPGAFFINTARAEVVDQAALLELARAGTLRVGTDVFAGEPEKGQAAFDSELGKLPGVYGTHHIGASTGQAQDAIAAEAVRILGCFARGAAIPNCVNVAKKSPAKARLLVRHLDKVGVLAEVLAAVREAGINVEEVQNTIFEGAAAASCTLQLGTKPSPELVARIRGKKDVILSVECVDL